MRVVAREDPHPDPRPQAGEGADRWTNAVLAALLFAMDPSRTGIAVRAGAGPVRDRWLGLLKRALGGTSVKRLPLHIRDERLLGGLDLSATLQAGRPVAQRGLLAESHGGVLLLAMAERLDAGTVARIGMAVDRGEVVAERDGVALAHPARFGLVALDEGDNADEKLRPALADRLALHIDLNGLALADAPDDVDATLPGIAGTAAEVAVPEALLEALCGATVALGVASPRAAYQALCVMRAHAALYGRTVAEADDAAAAARLVLAPRATVLPQPAEEEPHPQPEEQPQPPEPPPQKPPPLNDDAEPPVPESESEPEGADKPDKAEISALQDLLLQATLAALPPGLLAQLKAGGANRQASRAAGAAGAAQKSALRGRPVGVRRGMPRQGQRLNVIETLRAAVPWQKLRQASNLAPTLSREQERDKEREVGPGPRRIQIRPDDFHVTRLRHKRETTTVFAVDASGSAALQRLAEAKGAVELLLADCYVRRDKVAVIAFRGRGAELLLPPTRSLVRAKRALAGLPGGGGTPLAAALDASAALIDAAQRRGDTPVLVLLTDGRANVALDGTGGRARAEADALAAAARIAALGAALLLIDTSPQPTPAAARLAAAMGATYVPLPQAGAAALGRVVRAAAGADV